MLERFFQLRSHGTTVAREAVAGVTTFLAMAYILFVNPTILGSVITLPGDNAFGQLMTTTALAAAIGTLMMGLVVLVLMYASD